MRVDVTGEARLRVEGGIAHFPGRAAERVVLLHDLPAPERREVAELAHEARFFDCAPTPAAPPRPDARTYVVVLTLDGRSRELTLAEPIREPAMARLVSLLRRVAR